MSVEVVWPTLRVAAPERACSRQRWLTAIAAEAAAYRLIDHTKEALDITVAVCPACNRWHLYEPGRTP